jgi:hypothetical protein
LKSQEWLNEEGVRSNASSPEPTTLGIMSDGYMEEIWETLIALATAAAIGIGVVSLAAHLNETRAARGTESSTQATMRALPAGVAGIGAPEASHFN